MKLISSLLIMVSVVSLGFAQKDSLSTVRLKESHVIYATTTAGDRASQEFSADSLLATGVQDLASALNEASSVWVRSYGLSGAASPVFRGTSSSHTQVYWNGVNVNSATLGQADLRTVRLSSGQSVSVNSGLASLNDGSGGLGGSIHLNDRLSASDQLVVNLGAGSFGKFMAGISGNYTLGKWQFKTSGSWLEAENNFEFNNTSLSDDPIECRQDEYMSALTISQSVTRAIGERNLVSAHVLYSDLERGVADPIISAEVDGELLDLHKRALINWKRSGKVKLEAVAYAGEEQMTYHQNVFSQYTILSAAANGSAKFSIKDKHKFVLSSENTWNSVNSSGFAQEQNISRHSAKLRYDYQKGKFSTQVILREEVFRNEFSEPLGAISLAYDFNNSIKLFSSAGRTFRFPGLNDLFWVQGGNPDLSPESGVSLEAGTEVSRKRAKLKLTSFFSRNKDLIVWQPADGLFSPVNVDQTRIIGAEADLTLAKKCGQDTRFTLNSNISYTKAEELIGSEYQQLAFRPLWNTVHRLQYSKKNIGAQLSYSFMSERFGFNSSDSPLESIHLVDASFHAELQANTHFTSRIEFKINNIFSEAYEFVRWFPMPGRNFQINLTFKIK
ncbi:MAG: TonB-dependent receptor [Flavobacteriales bacterium]